MAAQNYGYNTSGDGRTGSWNLGNTCYMNAVFQCLVHTDPLRYYFITQPIERLINWENGDGDGWICFWFMIYVRQIWSNKFTSIRMRRLKELTGQLNPILAGPYQCDADELFTTLLNAISDDLRTHAVYPPPGVRVPKRIETFAAIHWAQHMTNNDSIITDLFDYQSVKTIFCRNENCEKKTRYRFDGHRNMKLILRRGNKDQTLRSLLKSHFSNSESDVPWECPNCGARTISFVKNRLWSLPQILVIQLMRFYTYNDRAGHYHACKIDSNIDYPIEGLDLSDYLHQKVQGRNATYDLFALVIHRGISVNNGHYWAVARTSHRTKGLDWRTFDDHMVWDSLPDEVKTPLAYLLFYVKRGA